LDRKGWKKDLGEKMGVGNRNIGRGEESKME